MRCFLHLVLAAGLALTWSCAALLPSRRVLVLLPPPPVHWQIAFPRLSWVVAARQGGGSTAQAVTEDWRGPLEIECGRDVNTTILAWPFVAPGRGPAAFGPGLLRPAGGFYPLCRREFEGREVVELAWEDGAAVLAVERAAGAGRDVSRFNAARLCQFLRRQTDPWTVDLDAAAQRIADGAFTAWDIERLETRDVEIAPGEGTWFTESPFFDPLPAPAGRLRLTGATDGSHSLFSLAGACLRLQVGEAGALLLPGP